MKKYYFLLMASLVSVATYAQGPGGAGQGKNDHPSRYDVGGKGHEDDDDDHYKYHGKGPKKHKDEYKYSKNIPAKVAESFYRDYPRAVNTFWTKSKGNWTATFNNAPFRYTATYHANGDRIDTQTTMPMKNAPKQVWKEILRRYPTIDRNKEIIRSDSPGGVVRYDLPFDIGGKISVISFDEKGNIY